MLGCSIRERRRGQEAVSIQLKLTARGPKGLHPSTSWSEQGTKFLGSPAMTNPAHWTCAWNRRDPRQAGTGRRDRVIGKQPKNLIEIATCGWLFYLRGE